jgi:hypothetical protein
MPRIHISASRYGTPGEVAAVEDGLVVRTGPIQHIAEAGGFDALFCHDDDERRLAPRAARAPLPNGQRGLGRPRTGGTSRPRMRAIFVPPPKYHHAATHNIR